VLDTYTLGGTFPTPIFSHASPKNMLKLRKRNRLNVQIFFFEECEKVPEDKVLKSLNE
jgi:hypothetical protein